MSGSSQEGITDMDGCLGSTSGSLLTLKQLSALCLGLPTIGDIADNTQIEMLTTDIGADRADLHRKDRAIATPMHGGEQSAARIDLHHLLLNLRNSLRIAQISNV